jgi:hypothetical protein
LCQREESLRARASMVGDRLRTELRGHRSRRGAGERGWTALLASHAGFGLLSRAGRGVTGTLGLVVGGMGLWLGCVFVPPYVSYFTFADKVTEIARTPVRGEADVRERLTHEIDRRGWGGHFHERACQVETAAKWRRITCDYELPVRVVAGLRPIRLRFHVAADEPYFPLDRE